MLTNNVANLVAQLAIVYLMMVWYVWLGGWLLKTTKHSQSFFSSVYARLFYQFLAGLFVTISLYSIIVTRGITINILILPLLYFLFWSGTKTRLVATVHQLPHIGLKHYLEMAAVAFLSLMILHAFPVNGYKQADGFFYLKIAEGMNASGQENISHYFNLYNKDFHGVEPYHYFEIWITAFIRAEII